MQKIFSSLGVTEVEVKSIIDNIHQHYTQVIKPKKKFGKKQLDKNGKVRLRFLLVPSPQLKTIQEVINSYLQQLPLPQNMYGAVAGKNNIQNAKQHLNKKYFFIVDLKDFFTYINHTQVFQMLVKRGFSASSARIISKLTTYQKSLPQGPPSSPIIANLVFADTVQELNDLIEGKGIMFTNYLDDLCFSSDSNFKGLSNTILNIIRKNRFYPSNNKIHYKIGSCEVTGLVVHKNTLSVVPKMREEAETNLYLARYVRRVDYENTLTKNLLSKSVN